MSGTIICKHCLKAFRPKENGISVLEQNQGVTIRIWGADLLECPGCGDQGVAGFSNGASDATDLFFEDRIKIALEDPNTVIWS